jgi:two-component system NtrC family response regulator
LLLATYLLNKYSGETKKKITGFTTQAIRAIETHDWPGNVRELENRLKRAVIMAEGTKLTIQDLELDSISYKYRGKSLKEAREALEKDIIQKALDRNKGNITKAAEELRVSRPNLYELMEKLGIEKEK